MLGVTGSIAAYKSAELIRLLKNHGAEVRVIMTENASHFVTSMTLQTLSGHPVLQPLMNLEREATMSHIKLARWADLILIAPATAQFIAKLAHGFADDLLSTTCLATQSPIAIAPAMNTLMWLNVTTQENVDKLIKRNIPIIGPDHGIQACGEVGEGRMIEPQNIIDEMISIFNVKKRLLGKKFLVTAGPTHEAIDPVRYISNPSSGKMGYAIAEAAAYEGAEVILISGPTTLNAPHHVKKIGVTSAQQMFDTVMQYVSDVDVFISVAAVSDYRAAYIHREKIKKDRETLELKLIRNPDILSSVARLNPRPIIVGFSAETDNLITNTQRKLQEKKLDMIVGNLVSDSKGFQSDYNEVIIAANNSEVKKLAYTTKKEIAKFLMEELIGHFLCESGICFSP